MKKKVFYALACILYLTGCSKTPSIEEVVPPTETYPVQFSLQMEKESISFPQTKSMPNHTIPEPSIFSKEEGDPELNDLCSTIEYVVFKEEDGTSVFSKHRQFIYDPYNLDDDFGCIYDTLPKGNYTFYFLAHNSGTADLSESVFSFDELSDTFYEAYPLSIGAAEEVNENVTLHRIVSQIEFMATDPVTALVKQFDMEITGRSVRLDIKNGNGIPSADKQVISHLFTPEEIGAVNMVHSFYTFVPPAGNPLTAHLSATAQNDGLLRERQVNNIIPEKNKIIRYKGRLYSNSDSDDTFQISIYNNGKWEEVREEDLPDDE